MVEVITIPHIGAGLQGGSLDLCPCLAGTDGSGAEHLFRFQPAGGEEVTQFARGGAAPRIERAVAIRDAIRAEIRADAE